MCRLSLCKNCYCVTKDIQQGHSGFYKCGKKLEDEDE